LNKKTKNSSTSQFISNGYKKNTLLTMVLILQAFLVFMFQSIWIKKIGIGSGSDIIYAAQTLGLLVTAPIISGLIVVWTKSIFEARYESVRFQRKLISKIQEEIKKLTMMIALIVTPIWLLISVVVYSEMVNSNKVIYFITAIIWLVCFVYILEYSVSAYIVRILRDDFLPEYINTLSYFAVVGLVIVANSLTPLEVSSLALIRAIVVACILRIYYKYRLILNFKNDWKLVFKKYMHSTAAASIFKTSPLIDRGICSTGPPGLISILVLAQSVTSIFGVIGDRVLGRKILRIVNDQVRTDPNYVKSCLRKYMISGVIIYISICLMGLILYHLGQVAANFFFSLQADQYQGFFQIILIILCGVISGVLTSPINSGLYSLGYEKWVAKMGVIIFVFGVISKLVLFELYGLVGLAVAISLQYVLCQFIFYNKLTKGGE
jgi:peptidoglycan biosynthesis protein MviN/MurJ (putative lipid II flippase)